MFLYAFLALFGNMACMANCPAMGTVPMSNLDRGSDWVPASSPVPECTDSCGHYLCGDGSFGTVEPDCHGIISSWRRALGDDYANLTANSVCEDGGYGSTATGCALGSDTTDCGCRNGTTLADWVGEREYGWSDRWDACDADAKYAMIDHGVGVFFSVMSVPVAIALFGHALWTIFALSADLIHLVLCLCAGPRAVRRGSAQNFERGAEP